MKWPFLELREVFEEDGDEGRNVLGRVNGVVLFS